MHFIFIPVEESDTRPGQVFTAQKDKDMIEVELKAKFGRKLEPVTSSLKERPQRELALKRKSK